MHSSVFQNNQSFRALIFACFLQSGCCLCSTVLFCCFFLFIFLHKFNINASDKMKILGTQSFPETDLFLFPEQKQ